MSGFHRRMGRQRKNSMRLATDGVDKDNRIIKKPYLASIDGRRYGLPKQSINLKIILTNQTLKALKY